MHPPAWKKPPNQRRAYRAHPEWRPAAFEDRWRTIVIHHSATAKGGAKTFDRSHRGRGWDELGYHFVIGNGSETPDGFVEVGPRWRKQKHGAHCKTSDNYYNDHGIGICLVGDFTHSRPTRAQLVALNELSTFLCRMCRIHASRITTHRDVTGKTQCPGKNFPLATVRNAVAANTHQSSARVAAYEDHAALHHHGPQCTCGNHTPTDHDRGSRGTTTARDREDAMSPGRRHSERRSRPVRRDRGARPDGRLRSDRRGKVRSRQATAPKVLY